MARTTNRNTRASAPASFSRLLLSAGLVVALAHIAELHAFTAPQSPPPGTSKFNLTTPPHTWAVDVAANELRAIQHKGSFVRYHVHTHDQKGDRVRDTIESKDGTVARLIMKDGKPLTGEEDQAERNRLTEILASPSEFTKHHHSDLTGKKLASDLVELMPDAMVYTYTPGQPQIASPISPQIVLDYAPNPKWSPPNTTAEGLTGLRGRMWIDPRTHQLIRMEGTIFQGVNFGWGMLAHVYPGGSLTLTQVNIAGDRWMFSSFMEHIRVRALMVKAMNVDTDIETSDVQVLPGPISYQDAIRLLLVAPPHTTP